MGTGTGRLAVVLALVAAVAVVPAVSHARPAGAATAHPGLAPSASPGSYDDVAGAELLARQINAARAEHGLPPLLVHQDLTAIAQAHSRRMAAAGSIWHNEELFTPRERDRLGASRLGENVGFDGGGAATTHQMYMDSPPHRASILDPRFTAMGIAVTVADGIAYSTEDFMQARTVPAPTPRLAATTPTPAPPAPAPPAPAPTAPAPTATERVDARAPATPAAPVPRTGPAGPTRALPSADSVRHRIVPASVTTPGPEVPAPLVAGMSLVNAALAWATVLAARRGRAEWAATPADR